MKTNFAEGTFLGRQEIDRMNLLNRCFSDSVSRLVGITQGLDKDGVFNPEKIGLGVSTKTINGVEGFAITAQNLEGSPLSLGRLIVGQKNGEKIGVVSDSDFTGRECFIPFTDLPTYEDTMVVLRLKPATTHYENALITVSSGGVGTISKGWDNVKDLFRAGSGGRSTKIKTEGAQVLTVLSVDTTNHIIQFEETANAETDVRFMFVQTLSPFVSDIPQPLYTYDTCEIVTDGVGYGDYEEAAFSEDNLTVPIATVWYTGSWQTPNLVSVDAFEGYGVPLNVLPLLDTVGPNQITEECMRSGCVTETIVADNAIVREKIGGLFENRTDPNSTTLDPATVYLNPGDFCRIYHDTDGVDTLVILREPSYSEGIDNTKYLPVLIQYSFSNDVGGQTFDVSNIVRGSNNVSPFYPLTIETPSGESGSFLLRITFLYKGGSSQTPIWYYLAELVAKSW